MSVIQYGSINTIDVPWTVPQEKAHLQSLVDLMQQEGGPRQIGNALSLELDVEPVFQSRGWAEVTEGSWPVTLLLGLSFL